MMLPDFFQGYSDILQPWGSGACVWFHTCPHRIWCTQEWFSSNWATTWKGQKHLYDSSAYWYSSVSPKSDWFVIGMDLFHNLSWIYLFKTQFGDLVSEKPKTNLFFSFPCLHICFTWKHLLSKKILRRVWNVCQ